MCALYLLLHKLYFNISTVATVHHLVTQRCTLRASIYYIRLQGSRIHCGLWDVLSCWMFDETSCDTKDTWWGFSSVSSSVCSVLCWAQIWPLPCVVSPVYCQVLQCGDTPRRKILPCASAWMLQQVNQAKKGHTACADESTSGTCRKFGLVRILLRLLQQSKQTNLFSPVRYHRWTLRLP